MEGALRHSEQVCVTALSARWVGALTLPVLRITLSRVRRLNCNHKHACINRPRGSTQSGMTWSVTHKRGLSNSRTEGMQRSTAHLGKQGQVSAVLHANPERCQRLGGCVSTCKQASAGSAHTHAQMADAAHGNAVPTVGRGQRCEKLVRFGHVRLKRLCTTHWMSQLPHAAIQTPTHTCA